MSPEKIENYVLLGRTARAIFRERENMRKAGTWIVKHGEMFSRYLGELDNVREKLTFLTSNPDKIPEDCINIRHLSNQGIKRFGTLSIVEGHYEWDRAGFVDLLKDIDERMQNWEDGIRVPGQYFSFHEWELSPETMAVAAIFEIAGPMYCKLHNYDMRHAQSITDGLIEALAESGGWLLTPIVFGPWPNGANFVKGYDGFSPEFRKRTVGEVIE